MNTQKRKLHFVFERFPLIQVELMRIGKFPHLFRNISRCDRTLYDFRQAQEPLLYRFFEFVGFIHIFF
ncbi:MAG: hypothetical protein JWM46_509 [Candidatus Kaiserbacteria bacterium]|nr:hypothetical protein [Candidatus Kaiserbacteria bacterium]